MKRTFFGGFARQNSILIAHLCFTGMEYTNQANFIKYNTIQKQKDCHSRLPRLIDTRYSNEGSAREMEICMQEIGCFRDCALYLFITF